MRKTGIIQIHSWRCVKMYNAVRIDVSKCKNTAVVLQLRDAIVRKPFKVPSYFQPVQLFPALCIPSKKHRDCYNVHWQIPWTCEGYLVQDQYVPVVNLHMIKKLKSISPHQVKSDPTDARRITSYTRDNWSELRLYSNMENTRSPYKHGIYNSDSLWRKTLLWK